MVSSDSKKQRKRKAMRQIAAVQAVLRRWDPLDVLPGEFAPADEYDDYAPHIVSLVAKGCTISELSSHLAGLRAGAMGMRADPDHDDAIAAELVETLRKNDPRES